MYNIYKRCVYNVYCDAFTNKVSSLYPSFFLGFLDVEESNVGDTIKRCGGRGDGPLHPAGAAEAIIQAVLATELRGLGIVNHHRSTR